MKHSKRISANIDEYLEEMYRCEIENTSITTKNLAEKLMISMPSVSEMLQKLDSMGLISHKSRSFIKLTKKGRKIGSDIYKKHETIKKFFLVLGLSSDKAAEQACRLEHELSNDALKKIDNFLKNR